ncbi:MAG: beta strand repeat-containing protein [Gemmataceae bacterium]
MRPCLEKLEDRTLLSAPTLTYTVNIAGDSAGGAGVGTPTSTGGAGNLRWCINQADSAVLTGTSYALIQFDPTVFVPTKSNVINLSNGELEISDNVTIQGPGGGQTPSALTISGADGTGNASRVFNITSFNATVTIAGLTIANGNANVTYTTIPGNQGGDIFNGGNLTLQNDIVTKGFSIGAIGGPPGRGGGIFNAEGTNGTQGATLTLDNTLVEGNLAEGVGGGNGFNGYLFGGSGGIAGPGYGGGVYNDSNALLVVENGSQIISDTALGGSGGIGGNGLNAPGNVGPGGIAGLGGDGGGSAGGGIFNAGILELNGTSSSALVISGDVAQGGAGGNGGNGGNAGKGPRGPAGGNGGNAGDGGNAVGGAIYNTGSFFQNSLQYVQFLGDQAVGGKGGNGGGGGLGGTGTKYTGGTGGAGGAGGNGGIAQGGALYNGVGTVTVSNSQFGADVNGMPDQAIGGAGGVGNAADNGGTAGSSGATKAEKLGGVGNFGGGGGAGGNAQGGAAVNAGTSLIFDNTSFTSSLAKGGTGGNGGAGSNGNLGGALTTISKVVIPAGNGGTGVAGGPGGAGGAALGGALYNLDGSLTITGDSFTANQAIGNLGGIAGNGGTGGQGGLGNSKGPGGTGGSGGIGGAGGAGGAAQGGGFYSQVGSVSVSDSSFVANATGTGNDALSGSGNKGGNGGDGGLGGDNTKLSGGPGGRGAIGGNGGDAGLAAGGAGSNNYGGNLGNNTKLTDVTITSSLVESGTGGTGGNGGNGGDSGNGPGIGGSFGFPGGAGGNAGAGGNNGPASGGAINAVASTLAVTGSTFGGSSAALGNQVHGGAGGAGGIGGSIGGIGHPPEGPVGYGISSGSHADPAGNGGHGGLGAFVSGGSVSVSSHAASNNITLLSSYLGMNANESELGTNILVNPPDTQGAAGPNRYIETVNQTIEIFNPKNTGVIGTILPLTTFFFTYGKLPHVAQNDQQSDPFIIYDPLIQRFIVGDLEFDSALTNGDGNALLLAVSKTSDPTTLTSADWHFSEVNTTQAGVALQDYPGNPGYNADGLVVTMNSFDQNGNLLGSQINTISMNALVNGTPLTTTGPNQNVFQIDSYNGISLRPTAMQDATPGAPMWFMEESNAGATNSTITVVKMTGATNILTNTPTFTKFTLPISNPYYTAVPLLQPTKEVPITTSTDSRFMNASMENNQIVTAQAVSNAAGNLDQVQWYEINTSSGTPVIQQQGDFGGGPGTYYAYPGIAINSSGDIGMTYITSGIGLGQYMSTYFTGRTPTDASGTMEPSILVRAGLENYYYGGREGDMSGISVDSNGSFWIANEYATEGTIANWGTVIAHFIISSAAPPSPTVAITNSTFGNSVISGGTGGMGGQGGLESYNGTNAGINGTGGDGGGAEGGAVYLSAATSQSATLTDVTATDSSASGGTGGAGNINYIHADPLLGGANGHGSPGGDGGSVGGVGLAALNYSLNIASSSFDGGTGTGGMGGTGGGSSAALNEPFCYGGAIGGNGGSARGGGIFFSNSLAATLNFAYSGGSASNNTLRAASGGTGGNAGASGSKSITGGAGGNGGQAQGGGLYVIAGSASVNGGIIPVALDSLSLLGDQISAGNGGKGGAGYNAFGGIGGNAQGGAVFASSLNNSSGQTSRLKLTNSTLAGDRATGGDGGIAGSATTPNGGAGGAGGNAGNAEGAGAFNGLNTSLTVYNSTFGGGSTNTTNANANANILSAGNGGAGGNAGTPAGVPSNTGGAGGNGGKAAGGNVYNSNVAQFTNDTLVLGQAVIFGVGGAGGSSAGTDNQAGPFGKAGSGTAGGYFAAAGSTNTIANTIIGLNSDAAGNPDVSGAFISDGNNLLTNTTGSTGFNTGTGGTDKVVPATGTGGLNLGPLLDNGGTTPTDAELTGSSAIAGGNSTLVPSGITADQRGFSRFYPNNTTVDVGAFEFQPPVIGTLSPNTIIEGASAFPLTITGNYFMPGATVSFGGTNLTPTTLSSTQITVLVPAKLLVNPGTIQVIVDNPDGSGLTGAGHIVSSAESNFVISPTPFSLNNPGNQINNAGDPVSLTITAGAGDSADKFTATNLPTGLSINAATGVISGTIATTAATNSPYAVSVNAYETGTNTNASVFFTWTINPPPSLLNPGNQTNDEGDTVSLPITTTTGVAATGYTATGLPPGLSINATTGVISGTINLRGTGSYSVAITPTNTGGKGGVSFTWTVLDTSPPFLTNPGLQLSTAGNSVNLAIQADDADPGSFTATGLPPGLSINATTGVISGTISLKAVGNYQVTVQAADGTVLSAPMTFVWSVTASSSSVSPPPSPLPPSPPSGAPGVPPGITGLTTNTTIVSVQNSYPGFFQLETVTVDVTNSSGYVVNEGVVAIQVNGQTVYAPVHDGVATASVATGLLDFSVIMDLLFSHSLTASYGDSANIFAPSGAGSTLAPILLDFFLYEIAQQFQQLTQFQNT